MRYGNMQYGFTFNGKHTSELGLIARTISRPFMPPAKIYSESVPDRDGSYDFSTVNQDGRVHYDDRVFEVEITAISTNLFTLQRKLSEIARWLMVTSVWADLIFDDMPTTKWRVRLENTGQVAYELEKVGIATLYFRAEPFTEALYGSAVLLSTHVPLDAPIQIGSPPLEVYTMVASGHELFIAVFNHSDWFCRPTITVSAGVKESFTIGQGDNLVGVFRDGATEPLGEITFDFANQKVNADLMQYFYGDFWEIRPGLNLLELRREFSQTHVELTIEVIFNYKFINEAVTLNA